MNLKPINKNNFEQWVQAGQRILAGIVGSTGIAIWISYMDWFDKIFATNLKALNNLRINIAEFGLGITCLVGIGSIIWLIGRLVEFKQNYEELIELKKEKDKGK